MSELKGIFRKTLEELTKKYYDYDEIYDTDITEADKPKPNSTTIIKKLMFYEGKMDGSKELIDLYKKSLELFKIKEFEFNQIDDFNKIFRRIFKIKEQENQEEDDDEKNENSDEEEDEKKNNPSLEKDKITKKRKHSEIDSLKERMDSLDEKMNLLISSNHNNN